jgi:hypothetical protein
MFTKKLLPLLVISTLAAPAAHAAEPSLIAIGSLSSFADLSGPTTGTLESGLSGNVFGGIGSGLAWAGGNTFLALPDRGPNATAYTDGVAVDNTTSYISRFQTVSLNLTAAPSGGLPYTLTPTLTGTTLLYSNTALNYGSTAGLPSAVPSGNSAGKYYFSGRSDNFAAGLSTNPANARLDPEGIRVSNDGSKIYVSDEYGPYVYQFDRASGQRTNTYTLPASFAISNLNSGGGTEISGNTSGRVANKGMEGLAISPDGKTLIGFVQSPLIQDGGDGGRTNRIITIDIASGASKQFAYDNKIGSKNYNSSEILALNDHQFLVLERDGKGLGDGGTVATGGSPAVVKQVWAVDLSGADDVSTLSGQTSLLAKAPIKTLFLDIAAALKNFGIADTQIPAKLEGMAFGQDIVENGAIKHTLYIANDNDFVPGVAGDNKFFVFSFTDADLTAKGLGSLQLQQIAAIPEPETYALMLAGLGLLGFVARRRNKS